MVTIPLHATFLGSGSHSPFGIHVVEFGPISTRLGQENLIPSPSSDGLP